MARRDVVVFNGKTFVRYPDAKEKRHNSYYRYNKSSDGKKTTIYLHVAVWENYHKKKVPKDHVIHHVDHNPLNNDISNLQLMGRAEHTTLHMLDKDRLGKPKNYICQRCGEDFVSKATKKSIPKFCSRLCRYEVAEKPCECCSKKFEYRVVPVQKYCSRDCFYEGSLRKK